VEALQEFVASMETMEEEFAVRGKEPAGEYNLHTWKDATLRELIILLKEIDPTFDEWGTKLTFSLVYPDKRGKNVMKEIGVLDAHKSGRDDHRTLDDLHFQLGDLIAISTFNRDSANANATSTSDEIGNQ